MAAIKCPDCGNEISDLAYKCPHCGRAMKITSTHPRVVRDYNGRTISNFVISALGLIFGIVMIVTAVMQEKTNSAASYVFMSFGILFVIGSILLFIVAMIRWKRTH